MAGQLQKGELSETADWVNIGILRLRVNFLTFLLLFPWGCRGAHEQSVRGSQRIAPRGWGTCKREAMGYITQIPGYETG